MSDRKMGELLDDATRVAQAFEAFHALLSAAMRDLVNGDDETAQSDAAWNTRFDVALSAVMTMRSAGRQALAVGRRDAAERSFTMAENVLLLAETLTTGLAGYTLLAQSRLIALGVPREQWAEQLPRVMREANEAVDAWEAAQ